MAVIEKKGTYKNLSYIVHTVQNDLGDYSTTNFQRLLQMSVQGLRQLNLYSSINNIKVAYLTVNSNQTVDLPDDYVDYTKIGFCKGGQIITLGQNDQLCLPRKSNDCGEPLSSKLHSVSNDAQGAANSDDFGAFSPFGFGFGYGYYFAAHFRNGQYIGELFGLGGGFAQAYYRIDKENWQIALSDVVPQDEIILEYKSDGSSADGSTVVPPEAIEALTMYVHWRIIEFDKRAPAVDKQRKRALLLEEETKLRAFKLAFTMAEYYDSFYASIKSGPKR